MVAVPLTIRTALLDGLLIEMLRDTVPIAFSCFLQYKESPFECCNPLIFGVLSFPCFVNPSVACCAWILALVPLHIRFEPRPRRPKDLSTRGVHFDTLILQQPHLLPVVLTRDPPPTRMTPSAKLLGGMQEPDHQTSLGLEVGVGASPLYRKYSERSASQGAHLLSPKAPYPPVSSDDPMTGHPGRERVVP